MAFGQTSPPEEAHPPVAPPATWLVARGEPSPQLALRILGLFAQQGLVPALFIARGDDDAMTIEVEQHGLDPHRATILLEKVRAIIGIETASLIGVD